MTANDVATRGRMPSIALAGAVLFLLCAAPVAAHDAASCDHAAQRRQHATVVHRKPRAERHAVVERVEPPVVEEHMIVREVPLVVEKRTTVETVPAMPVVEERTVETIEED